MVVPWMPAACQLVICSRHGSSDDTQLLGGGASLRPSMDASVVSSGSMLSATSQPCALATSRTWAIFLRPMAPERAISRSESPWCMRASI